jgi:hypothetical protein
MVIIKKRRLLMIPTASPKTDLPRDLSNTLDAILYSIFSIQDDRRELILWLNEAVPPEVFKQARISAAVDTRPEGIGFKVEEVEDFPHPRPGSTFYVLTLAPLDDDGLVGRLHAVNAAYIEIKLANGENRLLAHRPANGYFYPDNVSSDEAPEDN